MVDKKILDEIDELTTHQLITEVEKSWISGFIESLTIIDIQKAQKGIYTENYSMSMFKILGELGERLYQSLLVSPNKSHAVKRNFRHINKTYLACAQEINYHFGRRVVHNDSFVDYMCSQLPAHVELFKSERES